MLLKLLPISIDIGERFTCDWKVRKGFQKFCSAEEILQDEKGIGRACSLEKKQLQAVIEKNTRQSVKELSQTIGVSHYLQFHAITEH